MTEIAPGWYRDPVEPDIQRYWDGEAYVGEPLPADETPPPGPPPVTPTATAAVPTGYDGPTSAVTAWDAGAGTINVAPGASGTQASGAGTTQSPAAPGEAVRPRQHEPVPVQQAEQLPPGVPGWPPYPRLVLPPPRPHGFPLAGYGARFTARFIDFLCVLGLNIAVNGWFVYQWFEVNQPYFQAATNRILKNQSTSDLVPPEQSSTLLVIIIILAAALWFAYEVPQIANTGQTLGKRLAGIRVMREESEEDLGFRRAIRRWNTLGLPTLLWTCFGLGFLLQLVDVLWAVVDRPLRQALHDKSAQTVVVSVHGIPSREGVVRDQADESRS
ncbi:hypothetical protein Val02_81520 [Virgisporangium aliadipatigenens]|uniref:RDD family protein n=1 Tax=Virgisporangium aliadipatigenens TaxID=741659 RepID=A0A8J4DVB2_9ACTN|nr:RDD family protein [Virgisporangium aliadipatigenens]GIJ51266.1 hypothetical protein Val02_81520 [Virgisporangium aliadipatigenens]